MTEQNQHWSSLTVNNWKIPSARKIPTPLFGELLSKSPLGLGSTDFIAQMVWHTRDDHEKSCPSVDKANTASVTITAIAQLHGDNKSLHQFSHWLTQYPVAATFQISA